MLDTPTSTDDTTTEPPVRRRRRAASRPAGPPAPAAATPEMPAESTPREEAGDQPTDETDVQAPEPDAPLHEADEASMVEEADEVPAVDDAEADEAPADEAADQAAEPEPSAVEEPTRDEPVDETPVDDSETEETPEEPGAAEPDEASADGQPATEDAHQTAGVLAANPAGADAESTAPPAEVKPAARRRRATRATIVEVVEPETPATPETEPVGLDDLPTLDAVAPSSEPRPRRRRRKADAEPVAEASEERTPRRRRKAQADVPADAPDDALAAVAESLDELSRSGSGRRKRAKVAESAAAEALDQLAAAIGAVATNEVSVSVEVTEEDPGAAPIAETEVDTPVEQPVVDEQTGEPDSPDAADDPDDTESDDGTRRRRRRRGGRRRRRGGGDNADAGAAGSEDDESDGDQGDAEGSGDAEADGSAAEGATPTRRRRRRRRRGEDTAGSEDDPSDVVVRVREPRRSKVSDEVTGIDGSTRMEAKRQRRREGRAAGRRRSPILSESEFLARRESVERSMLIRQSDDYTQIAVLEDGVLVEHYVDRASAVSLIGNVYLGKVQNVLPSMEAAFIDIGRGRNAVLYAGEVDWDAFGVTGADRKVEKVLKSGQSVLVQVTKDPIGAKGARLTGHVSIPGRYVVYSPSGQLSGISRKLPEKERTRLKGILDEVVGESSSVIVRTAAEGATEEELVRDVNRLKAQWEVIAKKVKAGKSPEALYAEPDLTVRIVRDLFTEDFGKLVVDGNGQGEDAWDVVDAYVSHVSPHLKERLTHWKRDEQGDVFEAHRVDEQIAKALERKVFLPSGGSLIIDRTEAMTVIDVNTGKFTGTTGNLEATVTSNNLEAAEEIVRQLRLRDIGGIIVIDFIDMVLPANRELLLRRLVECLGRDRTRHQVAEVTSLGLVQMTRKKIGTGLAEAFTVTCETCHGRGYHRHDTPVDSQAPADGGEREHRRRRRH